MNYLAHLLLSGDDPELRFGNFVGDSIKGQKYLTLPTQVQKGVLLHRKIDTFTDHHPLIKESKTFLDPIYRHYKGVIIDVYFDHFLSKNWNQFHQKTLDNFLKDFEKEFKHYKHLIPEETSLFYEKFVEKMFMYHYDTFEGIELTFKGLEKRIGNRVPLILAVNDLSTHYEIFKVIFFNFFGEIENYCKTVRLKLDSDII